MTELRQKMVRTMELKNLSPHTQRAYLAAVKGLARHYRQSPTAITKEMIEDHKDVSPWDIFSAIKIGLIFPCWRRYNLPEI